MRLGALASLFLLAAAAQAAAAEGAARFGGSLPIEWSRRLADAEMSRLGDSLEYRQGAKAAWSYPSGFLAYALEQLGKASASPAYGDYGARIVDSFIQPDGTIRGYAAKDSNLDLIEPGRAVLEQYEKTRAPNLAKAAGILRRQLGAQPRTGEGAFWHKRIYPNQVWLDGFYMAGPFYAHYGALFGEPEAIEDEARQILVADRHLHDPASGLYYHAWDEARSQAWADPATGRSPSFWARAIGWYAMAVVDVLDDLPARSPSAGAVEGVLGRVAGGIVRWQDPQTGTWWQVVDQGPRPGNYHEASASSMFVYALAKAVNRGRLPRDGFGPAALKGYAGLVREFIRADADGRPVLTHCCTVAGLGNRNSAGRARDGSFAYYVSEPVVDNDLKGVAAFILAGLEVQRLLGPAPSIPAR